MRKINGHLNIRITTDDLFEVKEAYRLSGYQGSVSAYARDMLLGKIKHPHHINEEAKVEEQPNIKTVKYTGLIDGPEEIRLHYDAIVIASMMLKIKMDPQFQRYIDAEPEMFQKLIDNIRGYTFNDKTGQRTPLKKSRKPS